MTKELLTRDPPKPEELQEITEGRESFLAECKAATVITDSASYQKAGDLLVDVARRKKKVDALFDPIIEENKKVKAAAEKARKLVADTKDRVAAPFVEVENQLKNARVTYDREEAKRRAEEERRLNEQRQREAEDAALKEAEETGDDSVLDQVVVPSITITAPPKTDGVYQVKTWTYCASGDPLAEEYTTIDDYGFRVPDHKKIGAVVKALKQDTKITGVMAYEQVDERVRLTA
jgi:hypothetical protein